MSRTVLGKILRGQFPIFANNIKTHYSKVKPLCYLDTAASAQKPQEVIDIIKNHLEHDYATVHRGAYNLSAKSTSIYDACRRTIADFLGSTVKSENIIFTRGTTESLNVLASGLAEVCLNENARIVIPTSEHHSNLIPWQQAALRTACEIAYLNPKGKTGSNLQLNLAEAEKTITKNTKVVSLAHMGNVLGQINPVEEITKMAKKVGAFVILDCAQSITCLDSTKLFSLGVDAVVFSGHKAYGPSGVGVLAMTTELATLLPPFMFGGGMVSHVTKEEATWADPPYKFEAGTPPITEVIGLKAAVEWIQKIGGPRVIHEHTSKLTKQFIEGLKSIDGIELFSPETGHETLVSFRHKSIHAHDFVTYLNNENICMRAGHHCAWPLIQFLGVDALIRASFAVYNDEDDVQIALNVIKNISKM